MGLILQGEERALYRPAAVHQALRDTQGRAVRGSSAGSVVDRRPVPLARMRGMCLLFTACLTVTGAYLGADALILSSSRYGETCFVCFIKFILVLIMGA